MVPTSTIARIACAVLAAGMAGPAAQSTRSAPGEDPYTRSQPETLDALGYVRIGPMPWGSTDTTALSAELGDPDLRWIETEHFRLGCSLAEVAVRQNKRMRSSLGDDLEELAAKLPQLRPQAVRKLDPWLRAHLFAHRLECLYERVEDMISFGGQRTDHPTLPEADG